MAGILELGVRIDASERCGRPDPKAISRGGEPCEPFECAEPREERESDEGERAGDLLR